MSIKEQSHQIAGDDPWGLLHQWLKDIDKQTADEVENLKKAFKTALHVACSYGAPVEELDKLKTHCPEAMKPGPNELTLLHQTAANVKSKTVPVVEWLLKQDRTLVNAISFGSTPLRSLAEGARRVPADDKNQTLDEWRNSVRECLNLMLEASPEVNNYFFTALLRMPEWLLDSAVVHPFVQHLLNEKISQPFPTAVLMLDLIFLTILIVLYSFSVADSLQRRFDDEEGNEALPPARLFPLYVGSIYFFLRELVQIVSLSSLGVLYLWFYDPLNYLNVSFATAVLTSAIQMQTGMSDRDVFRIGSALSVALLWVKLLAFFRQVFVEFAVLARGILSVFTQLTDFLIALGILLVAFAQMFFTLFRKTDYCLNQPQDDLDFETILAETRCDQNSLRPYCHFWDSFLAVYTMPLRGADATNFESNPVGMALFVLFVFLIVIILANVLIAIVTGSYKIVREQKGAYVFWTNRLEFVAEMHVIANAPSWMGVKGLCSMGDTKDGNGAVITRGDTKDSRHSKSGNEDTKKDDDAVTAHGDTKEGDDALSGRDVWQQIMFLLKYNEYDVDASFIGLNFVTYTCVCVVLLIVVIPSWLLLGLLSLGWLWPPQVREYLLVRKLFENEDDLHMSEVANLQMKISTVQENVCQELDMDQEKFVEWKLEVEQVWRDILQKTEDLLPKN